MPPMEKECNNRSARAGYPVAIRRFSANHVTPFASRDMKSPPIMMEYETPSITDPLDCVVTF